MKSAYLFYVGRVVSRQKRCERLVELQSLLAQSKISSELHIFGNRNIGIEASLQRVSSERNIVRWHGIVNSWSRLIDKRSIQIFVSDYEGCPLALLEAQKAKIENVAAIQGEWTSSYLSSNCIFPTVTQMANAIIENVDLMNRKHLDTYFDEGRFYSEIQELKRRLLEATN